MRIDLHTHSTASDGTDGPGQLVAESRRARLDVIAVCDHDNFASVLPAQECGRQVGLSVLNGLELSCCLAEPLGGRLREVHLLGYGCRHDDQELGEELTRLRAGRLGRVGEICDRLGALGLSITEDDVLAQAAGSPSVGRPHIADVLVGKGFVADRRQAFDEYLGDGKPAFVPRYYTPLRVGIGLVQRSGGVAVVAHAWGPGSRAALPLHVLAELVTDAGMDGVEVDHPDHGVEVRLLLGTFTNRLGLIRTGSSDYHGTGKTGNALGTCTTAEDQYERLVEKIDRRGGQR